MAKRCIGIDVDHSCLRAVQVLRTGDEFRIEKVFNAQTRRSTDSLSDILRALTGQYGFDRRADVAISMPDDAVFFRNLETDFAGAEQIRKGSRPALEHNFPVQPDEIVAQVCSCHRLPDEKYSVLIAAVTRTALRERLNAASAAMMHPELVEAPIFAVHSAVTVNHPEITTGAAIIAFIDESYLVLAVTRNNDILIVRNIPIACCPEKDIESVRQRTAEVLSCEAEITWRKVFGTGIGEDTKMYLVTKDGVSGDLESIVEENLCCQITIVDPCAKVKSPPEYNGDTAMCIAEGLALGVLAPEKTVGINFLDADNADITPALNVKRELMVYAILVAAIGIILLVGLFIQSSHLETKYARIKNEIIKVFRDTLPEEKNIVSPLPQLEQKLQTLRTDYALFGLVSGTGGEPLDVLHAITKSIPLEANIAIDDMLITAESCRLTGISQSFESVYNWQRLLQKVPQFPTTDIKDIRRDPRSELVRFTVLVSLATPEKK